MTRDPEPVTHDTQQFIRSTALLFLDAGLPPEPGADACLCPMCGCGDPISPEGLAFLVSSGLLNLNEP